MEEKILALYARGMTTRDIESALMDLYGVTISHALIAQVTDAVLKSLFSAIREASKNWKANHHWKPALQSFQTMFGEERVPLAAL